ncbi:MAG: MFS transporter [Oscillospiraceae bacterium]|jgi:PPP family 3-phenylpropionic acid transporter|nr:MFS transporter [Oscillospiraceae bacterium]
MKRNAPLYTLMQAGIWGAYGIVFSYANRYLVGIGLSDTRAGLLLGVATALSFAAQPLLTAVTDRTGLRVRQVLLLASFGMLLCSAALPFLRSAVWLTTLAYAAACVFLQILPSFSNALAMASIRAGERINFGVSRGIGSVSFGVTAQITNWGISRFGVSFVPIFAAGICVPLLLSVALYREQSSLVGAKREAASGALAFVRNHGRYMLFLIGTTLLYIGHNALSNTMFRIAEFKGDGNAQGTAIMLAALVELPVMFLFVKMLRRKQCDFWLKLSGVFFTLRIALSLLLPGIWGLYAAQLAQILGFALFAIASVYYVGTIIPARDVVKGQTYLGASNTVGALVSLLISGTLVDRFDVRTLLLVMIAISAVGMLLVFAATERVEQTVGVK